ncbi:WXG100 family type VII secretion target [Actinokineospora guangxiensis]|uniref:WXG100 family type VII secretion target n=1 Tax=Actinokineospora guangxiensis TaxID=1490288 RepID=A0ABW0ELW9_9PSEU
MIGNVEELVQRFRASAERAAAARQAAERDRRAKRRDNDQWVTGGVNWDGFSLKSLQRMVGMNANSHQLDALADVWVQNGQNITRSAQELEQSMRRLMQFWSGASADTAQNSVQRNVTWLAETGEVAVDMARPIQDAGGALRSAQSTMPGGSPSSPWAGNIGGGAAVGMAIGGPIGAAFGAAIGGIASAFGFGSNKKKMKRKAVQTMRRYETALLGVDGVTPQFGDPADGINPGGTPGNPRPPGITPGQGTPPPSGSLPPELIGGPRVPPPMPTPDMGTTPSLAPGFESGWERRWQGMTGLGPGAGAGIPGAGGPGIGGGPVGFGGMPGAGMGRGMGGFGAGAGAGRGAMGAGRPGLGAGGGAGRGMGAGAGAGLGRGGAIGDKQRGATGRFGRGTGFGQGYGQGAGAGAAPAGARKDEDGEHKRRVPIEEDPFTPHDLRAAPPVIGL